MTTLATQMDSMMKHALDENERENLMLVLQIPVALTALGMIFFLS